MSAFLNRDPEMQAMLALPDEASAAKSSPAEVLPAGGGAASSYLSVVGGAYDAADRTNRDIALWTPPHNDADTDILPVKETVDARARDALRNDGYLSGADDIYKDSIVGAFFALNSKPEFKILGLDETWAQEFQEEVETKFTLAAESGHCWLDASRKMTLTDMVRLAVGSSLAAGEVLSTAEWINKGTRPFATAIQMVDLDRLETPMGKPEKKTLRGGVQMDEYGAPLGYWIRKSHPSALTLMRADDWKYVAAYKPWGRPQVSHLYDVNRADQTRGISKMVASLKQTRTASRFRDVMLQNAVVNATYAASIEFEMPSEAVYQMLGGGNMEAGDIQKAISGYASGYMESIAAYVGSRGHKIDGVKVPHLFPGTKLQLRPAGQGGPLGTEFEQSVLRYIAASLGLSYEEFAHDYSNTNYSSARASMGKTHQYMQGYKKRFADRFANFVFGLWLEEQMGRGEITALPRRAPSFWEGMNREAYTACEWIGAGRGQLDELKETQAAVLRLKYNLATREDELGRLGKDHRKVFAQLEREKAEMKARGIEPTEDNRMSNAISGAPREKDGGSNNDSEDDDA